MDPAVVWITWLVAFLIVEIYAALSKPGGDTLSENVWRWFGVRPRPSGRRVRLAWPRRAALLAFLLSLTGHLVFGWTVGPVIAFGAVVAWIIGYSALRER